MRKVEAKLKSYFHADLWQVPNAGKAKKTKLKKYNKDNFLMQVEEMDTFSSYRNCYMI